MTKWEVHAYKVPCNLLPYFMPQNSRVNKTKVESIDIIINNNDQRENEKKRQRFCHIIITIHFTCQTVYKKPQEGPLDVPCRPNLKIETKSLEQHINVLTVETNK